MNIEQIQKLLAPYDTSPTECDGLTRILHTLLCQHNIPHLVLFGKCSYASQVMPLHYWIDLLSPLTGWRVDYRARLWFGEFEDVPHGIFQPHDFSAIMYEGRPVELDVLPEQVFQLLMLKL